MTVIQLAENDASHKHTKHINVKYQFSKKQQNLSVITIQYVLSKENLADFFTKPLVHQHFQAFCKPHLPRFEGECWNTDTLSLLIFTLINFNSLSPILITCFDHLF